MISLIIVLTENPSETDLKNNTASLLIERHGVEDVWIASVLRFLIAKVNSTEVKTIAAYDFIELLGDGEMSGEWSLDDSTKTVRASHVRRNYGYNGSEVIIAILDSGINETHPGLVGKIIDHVDYTGTGYGDSYDHGTHVAGIAAGTGAGSPVGKLYTEVAPGASLLNVKVGTAAGWRPDWGVMGIEWAMTHGADVINLSLECVYPCPTMCAAVEDAVEEGVVVVAVAGNQGPPPGSIACPGSSEAAITVGSINDFDTESINDDQLRNKSGRGPVDDRIKPDVVAPGGNIMSPNRSGGYSNFNGTSAAAPHVAGVAALLLQAHPSWTPEMVKCAIKGTAMLNDELQGMANKENDRGKGIVDAASAISCCIDDIPVVEAEGFNVSGYGDYLAEAYPYYGRYYIYAYGYTIFDDAEANATLKRSFVPERNITNPTFLFAFYDEGFMSTSLLGWANLKAILRIWHGETLLFDYWSDDIHYVQYLGSTQTSCQHTHNTEDHAYTGELLAGQDYIIEYGFSVHAHCYSTSDFYYSDRYIQALALTIIGRPRAKNPSFEQRLKSVYEPAYWGWSDVTNDWRELRGDVGGDGLVDISDIAAIARAWGSVPGDPNWDPDCDLNGDEIVDISDMSMVSREFGKDNYLNSVDGAYSWYTSGNGDYYMEQWLCDHDVHALKGQQVTFSFWFKPNGIGNNAAAKIMYIIDSQQTTVSGNWIYATEGWHNATVTTTLPPNTVAIKVIIHLTDNFQTWIDKASIVTS